MTHLTYQQLLKKYNSLLEENKKLKAKLKTHQSSNNFTSSSKSATIINEQNISTSINKHSSRDEKIKLFMSLFKGRDDVYAKRWTNKKKQSGYSPVCLNEWVTGICHKPQIKCSKCKHRSYAPLTKKIIEQHLLGNQVVGLYPMTIQENCYFLAIDFDDEGWQKDIDIIRIVCENHNIPFAIERSRSGQGGHVWFFFENEISAILARKFGTLLLTYSMNQRYDISFNSYDRFFPNQDTMPKGGLGNLIALPLQKEARKTDNSVFVNEQFSIYDDQWELLNNIQKISKDNLHHYITKLKTGNELGNLKSISLEPNKPWQRIGDLTKNDFPQEVELTREAMLFINKKGLSQKALNHIQRLAAFKNPEFYKHQALRLPTYNKPRIISCTENYEKYLAIPRGCEEDLKLLLKGQKVKINLTDETDCGKTIDVTFNGNLRDQQTIAVERLLQYCMGVLSATTAFGKTVVGARLIAIRKVNTLILVHRKQLLNQWQERLSQFLTINEELPPLPKKRGRKPNRHLIGQLCGTKKQLNYIIDVALIQSLNNDKKRNLAKNYGMVIVDECHHVPAVSFEQVLKYVSAKYIYGLTATPMRSDGHHPIIFFYCGSIRYLVDAKQQTEKRGFSHLLIPRFTSFKLSQSDEKLNFQEIKSNLIKDDLRNQLIIDDIIASYKRGRNSLVLSNRVDHVNIITKMLEKLSIDVIKITGGMGVKKTTEKFKNISNQPKLKPLVLVATGSYIGEGFDEPRLDTLFLTMPLSWKGTLQQYAGRLHRVYEGKKEVQIFDYVDFHIRMLEKMYEKRLKGYASIGYKVKAENIQDSPENIIFNRQNFLQFFINDLNTAKNTILIVSPFITRKTVTDMSTHFELLSEKGIKVTVVTRPAEDFNSNRHQSLKNIYEFLNRKGVDVSFKSSIHQKFAIIDNKITWYGSINLLSFGKSEESIMRLVSNNIAIELIKQLEID